MFSCTLTHIANLNIRVNVIECVQVFVSTVHMSLLSWCSSGEVEEGEEPFLNKILARTDCDLWIRGPVLPLGHQGALTAKQVPMEGNDARRWSDNSFFRDKGR